ncbi:MAG: hypothetical protein M1436_04095 [Acidobacteria bacterium]|nr:hypothetical protein [Acidobacteriota bacterium]
MLRSIFLFALVGVLAYKLPAAPFDPQIAKEVAAVFAQAATEHAAGQMALIPQQQQLGQPDQPTFKPWSLPISGVDGIVLNYSPAMEGLVARVGALDAAGETGMVAEYCRAALQYLSAPQENYRALACEFLAHFPAAAVGAGALPGIGALLDDTAAAFHGMRQALPQQGPMSYTPISMTVADIARVAMLQITEYRFSSRAIFQRWWAGNAEYTDRLWYWVVRYRDTPDIRAQLDKLDPARELKIYLLLDNSTARRNEMEAPWRTAGLQPPADFAGGIYHHNPPNPVQAGQFVAAHHLQHELFDLLAGTTTWPEVKDNTGWGETALALAITEVGRNCWTRADAATIEQILNSGRGLAVHENRAQTGLTEVAVSLDGARLESIVLGQLARNPQQPDLTTVLLANTGLKHWKLIRGYYDLFNGDGQARVIRALGDMAIRDDMRAALCSLFAEDHLEAALTPDGNVADGDQPRRDRLSAYAAVAERLNNGKPVVNPAVLQAALSYGMGKIDNATRDAQIAAMPAARKEAVNQLAAFFAKVKPAG